MENVDFCMITKFMVGIWMEVGSQMTSGLTTGVQAIV